MGKSCVNKFVLVRWKPPKFRNAASFRMFGFRFVARSSARPNKSTAPPESGAASCVSMSERPERADTWYAPLLRPTVAGHGLPADSRRVATTLDVIEAKGRGLGSIQGLSESRSPGIEARNRGQEAFDPTKASESWYKRYKAGFEAYSAELLRQGWEPRPGPSTGWGDFPKGWSDEDFNAELSRHGCERRSGSFVRDMRAVTLECKMLGRQRAAFMQERWEAKEKWYERYKAGFEAYSAELLRQGWEPSTGSFWGDVPVILVTGHPMKGWSEEDFNAELLRHGCDPPSGSLWSILLRNLCCEKSTVYCEQLQKEARAMKKVQKEQKAQDVQMARDKMQKERVESGGSWTDTWTGHLRHACSGMRVRKSRRVAPAPSAASEGRTFCSQPQIVECSVAKRKGGRGRAVRPERRPDCVRALPLAQS